MVEEDSPVDKWDWMYFVAGGLAVLALIVALKYILKDVGAPQPQIVERQVESVYSYDSTGKIRRGYL